ncbi:MAG: hypothetical protein KatS3mg125_0139 [Lysobacterales bacterium]|nr:MAG: hypothetical protein KatS3mg125_0139 [Xanthomonadales bacterium]
MSGGAAPGGGRPFASQRRAFLLAGVLMVAVASAQAVREGAWKDPATAEAERLPLVARSLLLAGTQSAQRAVVVGERGHVLLSESRTDWRQARLVPTRSTLTAVTAVGDKLWAVGHDQVIIHSSDGGETWSLQHASPWTPEKADDPRASAPLLSVLFLDENRGFAVGAYGLLMRTEDGGRNWERVDLVRERSEDEAVPAPESEDGEEASGGVEDWLFSEEDLELGEEEDPHLNAIVRTGDGSLFIAAERGAAFRSTDGGENWERISLPYEGSMFGAIGYQGRHVLVYGLRGHVFESLDLGDTWRPLETGTELSIMGGAPLADGGAVLVGANGLILTRSAGEAGFRKSVHPDGVILSAVLPIQGTRQFVTLGENGISTYVVR